MIVLFLYTLLLSSLASGNPVILKQGSIGEEKTKTTRKLGDTDNFQSSITKEIKKQLQVRTENLPQILNTLTTDPIVQELGQPKSYGEEESYENEIVLGGIDLFNSLNEFGDQKMFVDQILYNLVSITDKMRKFLDTLVNNMDDATIKLLTEKFRAMEAMLS